MKILTYEQRIKSEAFEIARLVAGMVGEQADIIQGKFSSNTFPQVYEKLTKTVLKQLK